MQERINEAKLIPIESVLAKLNIQLNNAGFCHCPFHTDKTPSLRIYPNTNSFYCFSCCAAGDVVNLIRLYYNTNTLEAIEILLKTNFEKVKKKEQEWCPIGLEQLAIDSEVYQHLFDLTELTNAGKEYLTKIRCLSLSTIELFRFKSIDADNDLLFLLLEKFSKERLKNAGLLTERNSFIFSRPCILFFHYKNKRIVSISTRNLAGDRKSTKLNGIPFQNWEAGSANPREILIFEGILDAVSYWQLKQPQGKRLISTGGLPPYQKLLEIAQRYKCKITLCLDNDAAAEKHIDFLLQNKHDELTKFLEVCQIKKENPNVKDWNELLLLKS